MAMKVSLSPSKRSKTVLDDSSGIVRLVREQPPEHCILKVDSFSVFQETLSHKSSDDYMNSTEFKAGGYTWMLCVYPKGNEEEGGNGHISLYVTLVDKLNTGTSVDVALRFFIYDQIRNNYLSFLDIKEKCFNCLKSTWGIPKLMPLESFTKASNGFLVNDCCVFGAEVLVKDNGQIKRSTASLVDSDCDMIYTWRIENFSSLKYDDLYSPIFRFGKWSWKLYLFPRGNRKGKGKYLSLYLKLDNANELTHGSKLYTKYSLCIKNQRKGADHKKTVCKSFHSEEVGWGFSSFLSISDVYNTSKGFLVNDTLIVEAKVEVMLSLKDMENEED